MSTEKAGDARCVKLLTNTPDFFSLYNQGGLCLKHIFRLELRIKKLLRDSVYV